jgi:hypothetical protein
MTLIQKTRASQTDEQCPPRGVPHILRTSDVYAYSSEQVYVLVATIES